MPVNKLHQLPGSGALTVFRNDEDFDTMSYEKWLRNHCAKHFGLADAARRIGAALTSLLEISSMTSG